MRKALTITLVAALALFAGSAAYANYCARDVVPASTILVPWAVQDMANGSPDPDGYATILTITNVSRDAQVIHITVWSAISEACLDFNEVLSGYDVWQINFRDMLRGAFGNFDTDRSSTAWPNVDPTGPQTRDPFEWGPDGRSAFTGLIMTGKLPVPETTGVASSSNTVDCHMPYGNGLNVESNVNCLRGPLFARDHAGCANLKVRADFDNDWLSTLGNDPLFFYVTVDVAQICNFKFPNDTDYFTQYYLAENVLIGDIVYVSSRDKFSEAINAVHIESDPPAGGPQYVNFYEPNVDPVNTSHLEPLATAFAFNYYNIPDNPSTPDPDSITTNVMVWKNYADFWPFPDAREDDVDDCGYYLYYAWDQDEHTNTRAGSCRISPCNPNDIDPNEFPFETQSVPLTTANFDLPAQAGWMLVVFQPAYPVGWNSTYDPTPGTGVHPQPLTDLMGWMGTKINYGTYSAALEAATMANTHCFAGQRMPGLGGNWDYDPPTE